MCLKSIIGKEFLASKIFGLLFKSEASERNFLYIALFFVCLCVSYETNNNSKAHISSGVQGGKLFHHTLLIYYRQGIFLLLT